MLSTPCCSSGVKGLRIYYTCCFFNLTIALMYHGNGNMEALIFKNRTPIRTFVAMQPDQLVDEPAYSFYMDISSSFMYILDIILGLPYFIRLIRLIQQNLWCARILLQCPLADPRGGGAAGARPPNRIQFFRFRICFRQKAPALVVGAPNGSAPPPTENPGCATALPSGYFSVYIPAFSHKYTYLHSRHLKKSYFDRKKNL